jgi:hypothetical protein
MKGIPPSRFRKVADGLNLSLEMGVYKDGVRTDLIMVALADFFARPVAIFGNTEAEVEDRFVTDSIALPGGVLERMPCRPSFVSRCRLLSRDPATAPIVIAWNGNDHYEGTAVVLNADDTTLGQAASFFWGRLAAGVPAEGGSGDHRNGGERLQQPSAAADVGLAGQRAEDRWRAAGVAAECGSLVVGRRLEVFWEDDGRRVNA